MGHLILGKFARDHLHYSTLPRSEWPWNPVSSLYPSCPFPCVEKCPKDSILFHFIYSLPRRDPNLTRGKHSWPTLYPRMFVKPSDRNRHQLS